MMLTVVVLQVLTLVVLIGGRLYDYFYPPRPVVMSGALTELVQQRLATLQASPGREALRQRVELRAREAHLAERQRRREGKA